jgi:hypothetical protein
VSVMTGDAALCWLWLGSLSAGVATAAAAAAAALQRCRSDASCTCDSTASSSASVGTWRQEAYTHRERKTSPKISQQVETYNAHVMIAAVVPALLWYSASLHFTMHICL